MIQQFMIIFPAQHGLLSDRSLSFASGYKCNQILHGSVQILFKFIVKKFIKQLPRIKHLCLYTGTSLQMFVNADILPILILRN
jgi:hypothetical protein